MDMFGVYFLNKVTNAFIQSDLLDKIMHRADVRFVLDNENLNRYQTSIQVQEFFGPRLIIRDRETDVSIRISFNGLSQEPEFSMDIMKGIDASTAKEGEPNGRWIRRIDRDDYEVRLVFNLREVNCKMIDLNPDESYMYINETITAVEDAIVMWLKYLEAWMGGRSW